MEIRMKTSIVVRMLQMMSARLKEGKALFDPIKISIIPRKDDKYHSDCHDDQQERYRIRGHQVLGHTSIWN